MAGVRSVRVLAAITIGVLLLPLAAAPALALPTISDFNGDGYGDLAVGVPGEDDGAGAVQILYGSSGGLTATPGGVSTTFWYENNIGLDTSEGGEQFGSAVAMGDFDGDGYTDLAVSAPYDNVGGAGGAGTVTVLYGSSAGLTATDAQYWTQDSTGILGTAESQDLFGIALTTGDFNGDNRSDLVVGVPFENVGTVVDAGMVNVLYGSSSGLEASGNQAWTQDASGIKGSAETNDRFGAALAAGNFGRSSYQDLAIGSPGEDVGAINSAGRVSVIYGSGSRLTATGDQAWDQDSTGIQGTAEENDAFGSSLAAANFGKSSEADLAIGLPGAEVNEHPYAGAVAIIYGSSTGLTSTGDQLWTLETSGVTGTADDEEFFGAALAAADFGGTTHADLAIGAPFEAVGAVPSAGTVRVLFGSSTGITGTGDQLWSQDTIGVQETAEPNEGFGFSLAAANFNNASKSDLAIGVPGESYGMTLNAGAVNVLPGSSTGLSATGDQLWTQGNAPDDPETDDNFGRSLAPRGSPSIGLK